MNQEYFSNFNNKEAAYNAKIQTKNDWSSNITLGILCAISNNAILQYYKTK